MPHGLSGWAPLRCSGEMGEKERQNGSCMWREAELKTYQWWRAGYYRSPMLPSGVMCVQACTATKNYLRVCGTTEAGVCVDVCDLCYQWRSYQCLWSGLPPKAMLMSEGHATTNLSGLNCHKLKANKTPVRRGSGHKASSPSAKKLVTISRCWERKHQFSSMEWSWVYQLYSKVGPMLMIIS